MMSQPNKRGTKRGAPRLALAARLAAMKPGEVILLTKVDRITPRVLYDSIWETRGRFTTRRAHGTLNIIRLS